MAEFGEEEGVPTRLASKTTTRDPALLGPAVHPGEMLLEEYLKPLGLSQVEAARGLGTPQIWMHLQADWDLHQALRRGSAA